MGRRRHEEDPDVIKRKIRRLTKRLQRRQHGFTSSDDDDSIPKINGLPSQDTLEQRKVLSYVIQNSTAMPFRWYSNKYMCFYCSSEFRDSTKLIQHTNEEHEEVKLKNVLKALSSRVKLDVTNLACKLCPKPIKSLEDFLNHANSAHDVSINKDACKFLHSFKLSDSLMNCLECGESFRFFGPLLRHVHNFHNKLTPFLCEICGQGFVGKANVESHVRNVHSDSSNPCKKCGEVFQTPFSLRSHNNKVHNTDQLKCHLCSEVLGSKYLKKRHIAISHGVKAAQFTCDECGKVFVEKNKMINHRLRVHVKEKSVTCDICGFKVFSKYYLKRHLVKHSDERPFECQYCKKTFQRMKTLKFHIRIHTDDKRYACKECGKTFVQAASLKSHSRSHHS